MHLSSVELFNLALDPSEKTNLAEKNPQIVKELQQRIETLAKEAVPSLFLQQAFGVAQKGLFSSVTLPEDEYELERQP